MKDWVINAPEWLEIKQADVSVFIPNKRIGASEREAIALALELNAAVILIDDRDGTLEAKKQGLISLGTVNILERAAEMDLLDLATAIDRRCSENKPARAFDPGRISQRMRDGRLRDDRQTLWLKDQNFTSELVSLRLTSSSLLATNFIGVPGTGG